MSVRLTWIFMISYSFLVQVAGTLYQPLNVTTVSRNFRLYLTWIPAPGNPPNVSYQVCFKHGKSKWKPFQNCRNITVTECDLTCSLENPYWHYSVGVRTISGSSKSRCAEIENLTYIFTVEPDPPILQVKQTDKNILINANVQIPSCINNNLGLRYNVDAWKNGDPKMTIFSDVKMGNEVTWLTAGLKGNYCIAAKTIYTKDDVKTSKLSSPVCYLIHFEGQNNQWQLILGILPLLLICLFIFLLLHYFTKYKKKPPDVLDFSNYNIYWEASAFESSEMFLETYNQITTEQIEDKSSSTTLLLRGDNLNEDDYTLNHFGYADRHAVQNEHAQEGSEGTNSSYYKHTSLSDLSCGECENTSGPSFTRTLTLDKFQKENLLSTPDETKEDFINAATKKLQIDHQHVQRNPQTGATAFCQLASVRVSSFSDTQNVCFESLRIDGKSQQLKNSDGVSCDNCSSDFEGSTELLHEALIDNEMEVHFYSDSKDLCHQTFSHSGYEHRGYMSREC